ncbi:hypothetical protein GON26_01330 [Flavobacterium sp. GA093]|uniref:Phage protein D n=1 Tax=Flavobacterium hydrocarbonoxydans TaxID=2683249 RepID=A0A6I4NFV0_9FLAO|nr:hypothetical protein [Flavobacterium hydrocarbonoxydans]MWB92991.1 hypothetical protein [Flavobacterium hydrocarbonoxydans]
MLDMDWRITFKTKDAKYQLMLISEVEIDESVENLVDTATITLPEAVMNQVLNFQQTIGRGSEVLIELGYDKNLEKEFVGYVLDIVANDSSLQILCEDALFLFRVGVKDAEMKPTSSKKIAESIIDQIDKTFKVSCDYDIGFEKFIIHQATGYDVLKKLQEETKANIYFDTKDKVLHIHAPYLEKGGDVVYSMQENIEKSSLEYKRALDKKVEVTIESIDLKGNVRSYTTGTTGGEKITLKVGAVTESDMKKIAATVLQQNNYDGFDGSIDTWLIPFVKPTYSAHYSDDDYPEKKGVYYVVSTKTTFSDAGAKRAVKFGIKLA